MSFDSKACFEWFHMHPELSDREHATTEKIKEILTSAGIEVMPSGLPTGLVALVRGGRKGRTVAFRADIDALPVKEETGLAYASENEGVMHACGHDVHMTAAIGAALALQQERESLGGKVYFIFQPSEENFGGAKRMIKAGVAKDAEEFWALHADPTADAGTLGLREGCARAAGDLFRIEVSGTGTHAAAPHMGDDPIEMMTNIISAIRALADRRIDPLHPRVISFSHIEGGNTYNVIPDTVTVEGTVRTVADDDRQLISTAVKRIVSGFDAMSDMKCTLRYICGPPPVINDEELCAAAAETAERLDITVSAHDQTMVSDDFSEFTASGRPGMYIFAGTGKGRGLHSPGFKAEKSALDIYIRFVREVLKDRTKMPNNG